MKIKKHQLFKSLFKRNRLTLLENLPRLRSEAFTLIPDTKELDLFNRLVGWTNVAHLAPTWLQMTALPAYLNLITDSRFPFSPLGLVHVSNEITLYHALPIDAVYKMTCEITQYQQHAKGILCFATITASVGEQKFYQSEASFLALIPSLARQEKQRKKSSGKESSGPSLGSSSQSDSSHDYSESWQLADDIGRQYADISGDYNLIHLNPFTAKLFGFKRHIAHGMFLNAKALSTLCAKGIAGTAAFPLSMSMDFKKPVFLPAELKLGHSTLGQVISYDLYSESGLHASGKISGI